MESQQTHSRVSAWIFLLLGTVFASLTAYGLMKKMEFDSVGIGILLSPGLFFIGLGGLIKPEISNVAFYFTRKMNRYSIWMYILAGSLFLLGIIVGVIIIYFIIQSEWGRTMILEKNI